MVKEKKSLILERLESEKKFLRFSNFYPSPNPKLFQIAFGVITFIYSYILLIPMIALPFVETDYIKLAEAFLFFFTQIAFLCKLTNLLLRRRQIDRIETILCDPMLNDLSEDDVKILDSSLDLVQKLAVIYRLMCVFCLFFYGGFPFIDANSEHLLAFPGWFPFDVKTYQYPILFGQVFGISLSAFNNSNMDILTATLISIASAEFIILRNRLERIRKTSNKVANKEITNCAKLHNILLEYVFEIENLFNSGIFVQFFASVLVICLTLFQMIISNGILDACYMSEWYKCDKKFTKSLFIIMQRGSKPVHLTAGKLFTLSLPTLMAILRSSYSYFAVLQRLYQDKI